jgi:hypothetical protein
MLVSDPIGSIFSKLRNIKERTGTGGHTVIHSKSRAHNLYFLFSIGKRFIGMPTKSAETEVVVSGGGGGGKVEAEVAVKWRR